ncbi:MAG: beta-galactosidase [Thermoflexales bacterium]|nr:beta-galactosidase [Thermoflexales bacterium]
MTDTTYLLRTTQHATLSRDGLLINDRPFYILSGVVHYFRWPKAEWRDLLMTAKAGGLNTVDTVIPWNLHEPRPGEFNFDDYADLPAYLDLVHELGLYAIVRPGPYICAEWENGGFPAWLTAQDVKLRVDDPIVLPALKRWFDRLLPIFESRQIDVGGPIILCQIENEYWASGTFGHDAHQQTLAQLQHDGGIRVPMYTCMGAIEGYPEFRNGWNGLAVKLQQTRSAWPDNPMIVSELWSGWFDNWGSSAHNGKTPEALDRALHELTSVGCAGVSHWMWAGGTNFGSWGGRTLGGDLIHMSTTYDYDAPVNEYNQPTAKFYAARRHHLFLSTFGNTVSRLLADAKPGGPTVIVPPPVKGRAAGGEEPYRTVKNGDFSATFLQNNTGDRSTLQVFNTHPNVHLAIETDAHSIKPLFFNLPISPRPVGEGPGVRAAVRVNYHTSRLLGLWSNTLVCYGFEGEVGSLQLHAETDWQVSDWGNARGTLDGHTLTIKYWITDRPTIIRTNHLTIVLLTQARAERWWPLADGSCVCGPDLVLDDGTLSETGITPFYKVQNSECRVYNHATRTTQYASRITLDWETLDVTEFSSNWLTPTSSIQHPTSLESLGTDLGYGWYATRFNLDQAVDTTLVVPWINDRGHVFVDGQRLGCVGVDVDGARWTLPLKLEAGAHEVRVLADNLGRFNYGAGVGERKGLLDTLYLGGQQIDLNGGWSALWQEAQFAGEALAHAQPQYLRADARNVDLSNFAFQGAHVWLLREIEVEADETVILKITGDRNPGALYVNGTAIRRFSRHHGGGLMKHDITAHVKPGVNIIAIHIENYAGLPWDAQLLRYQAENALGGPWYFQSGVSVATTPAPHPSTTPQRGSAQDACRFYRARFGYDQNQHGTASFKFDAAGLRKGQLWLNGRNLGRYWQVGPQEFYKVPASWLHAENELLIFEEETGYPIQTELIRSSR